MKNGLIYYFCRLVIVSWLWLSSIVLANQQVADQSEYSTLQSGWQTKHLKNGISRIEFDHIDKTHYYQLQLIGVELDGREIELTEPELIYKNNYLVKKWLPFLQETWVEFQGGSKWVFEITGPDLAASKLKLNFEFKTDGRGGISVGDSFNLLFDQDTFGNPLEQAGAHNSLSKPGISLSFSDAHCLDVYRLNGYHNISEAFEFDLKKEKLPIYILNNSFKNGGYKKDWYLSRFSQNNGLTQLTVPTRMNINGVLKKEIAAFQKSDSAESFSKVSVNQLNDYFKYKESWIPIDVNDRVKKLAIQNNKNPENIAAFRQALSTVKLPLLDEHGNKPIIIDGQYMYVVSNGYGNGDKVHVFINKHDSWETDQIIEVNQISHKEGIGEVHRSIAGIHFINDLMVIGLETYGYSTDPKNYQQNQSTGEVLVYKKINGTWQQYQTLVSKVGELEDGFGEVLAVGNKTIAVAANQYGSDNKVKLNGLVHMFEFESGKWQFHSVIEPPEHAKNANYFSNQGFGGQIELVDNDLYIKSIEEGYSSNDQVPNTCPYFDSFGAIYHYQKTNNNWKLVHEIRSHGGSSNIFGDMIADEKGLYFLTSETGFDNNTTEYFIHYQAGKIVDKQKLIN